MKTPPLWAIVIGFVTSVAAYVTMAALHLDVGGLVTFVGVLAGLLGVGLPSVATLRNTQIIKEQTNGPLQATHSRLQDVESAVGDISQRLSDKGV